MLFCIYREKISGSVFSVCVCVLQCTHHHMAAMETSKPIRGVVAEEGAELHKSELQHLKVKLETWGNIWASRPYSQSEYFMH